MFEQVQRQEHTTVVVASSEAAAEFVAVTLQAHGVPAVTHAYSRVYPSVDWAEGYRVEVAQADEERARELLAGLARDRDDVAEVDDV